MRIFRKVTIYVLLMMMGTVFWGWSDVARAENGYSYENSEALHQSGLIKWRDYGPEAFSEAVTENKPIFLLLTAESWCYWCQVYNSRDYLYNDRLYPYINEHFIPIYVDADRRQDLTRHYLEGGWPSTTVMTPDRKRIFGFSGARPAENMLANLAKAVTYTQNNIGSSVEAINYKKKDIKIPNKQELDNLIANFYINARDNFDSLNGGFGGGQKFPRPLTLDALLDKYEQTQDRKWLGMVAKTLEGQFTKLSEIKSDYNLFDPVEGGFHRYGTKRDWTPPHYEKMLTVNTELLRTYTHLLHILTSDKLSSATDETLAMTKVVIKKTKDFLLNSMYDREDAGFYGNVDAYNEDEYYGEVVRPVEKPRIEKTKFTDWNARTVVALLSDIELSSNTKLKKIALKTLDFLIDNMMDDQGVFHYLLPSGEKKVQGNILDNSSLLLAVVRGYEMTHDERYLTTASRLADDTIKNFYDWNAGGFMERHSKDTDIYAEGETILTEKPARENGVMITALSKLYLATKKPIYLNTAIKTLGQMLDKVGYLDDAYYYLRSAKIIMDHDLLQAFNDNKQMFLAEDRKEIADFWLNKLLKPESTSAGFIPTTKGLTVLSGPIVWLLLIAFVAGLLSFLSPCTLPILPAYLAYSIKTERKQQVLAGISFLAGLIVVFTILGMTATAVVQVLRGYLPMITKITGVLLILFGFVIALGKGFTGLKISTKPKRTVLGAFSVGMILGLSWTPCVGPILVAILLLASTTSSVATGGVMLLVYGLGLGLPLLLFSVVLKKMSRKSLVWRMMQGKSFVIKVGARKLRLHTTLLISGLIFIVLGGLIFSGALTNINQIAGTSSWQSWFFGIEEKLLEFLH